MEYGRFAGFEESRIDSAVFGKALTDRVFRERLLQEGGSIEHIKTVLREAQFPHDDDVAQEIAELRDSGAQASIERLYMRPDEMPDQVPDQSDDTVAFG